jgi:DNA-binding Lrp family transcriptional regulator
MRPLDSQEVLIARALIRDPRMSDNAIGEATGVNVRTVSRKRQRLEQAGILSYFTHVDLTGSGTGQYPNRALLILKFKLGLGVSDLLEDIQRDPAVREVFTEMIFESHIAEIDGHTAMLLFIDGATPRALLENIQEKLIPSLRKNHGADSVVESRMIQVLAPVRILRNYLPPVNMTDGYLRDDWPECALYVGNPAPEEPDDDRDEP